MMKSKKKMERKSFSQLTRNQQVCLYLHDHPEALTEDLMIEVAARCMNYSYIRFMIRDIYQKFVQENLEKDNFVIVENYNE